MRTYPEDTFRFLQREKDRFANPVGFAITSNLETAFEQLLGEMDPEAMNQSLDAIIRIRAVQDFKASQAVGFILLLKDALDQSLDRERLGAHDLSELLALHSRIDRTMLMAFDLYMCDREKVFDIRAREIQARSVKLIERLNRRVEPD